MNATLKDLVDAALAKRVIGVDVMKGYKSKTEACICDCDTDDNDGGCSD